MKRFQPIAIISPMYIYIHLSVAFRYYNIESLTPHHKLGSVSFVADPLLHADTKLNFFRHENGGK